MGTIISKEVKDTLKNTGRADIRRSLYPRGPDRAPKQDHSPYHRFHTPILSSSHLPFLQLRRHLKQSSLNSSSPPLYLRPSSPLFSTPSRWMVPFSDLKAGHALCIPPVPSWALLHASSPPFRVILPHCLLSATGQNVHTSSSWRKREHPLQFSNSSVLLFIFVPSFYLLKRIVGN